MCAVSVAVFVNQIYLCVLIYDTHVWWSLSSYPDDDRGEGQI